jgi:hypothetical protein
MTDPAAYAKNYDFVWGADPGNMAVLRTANPNIFLSFYITVNRDTGTFLNQDAKQSISYWQAVHGDTDASQTARPASSPGLDSQPGCL